MNKHNNADARDKKLSVSWDYLLLGVLVFTVFISEIAMYILGSGIVVFISHMFYFPLFFLVFRYPGRGLDLALAVGIVYLLTIVTVSYSDYYNLMAGLLFFFALVGIGTGTSVAAENLRAGESRLYEFKKNYQNLLENTNDSVIVHNMKGEILVWNKKAGEMFELDKKSPEDLNVRYFNLIPENMSFEEIKDCLEKTGSASFETVLPTGPGEEMHVEVNSSLTDSDEGYVHVFIKDISEKKKARIALEEGENRLRVLTNQIPEMLFETDDKGTITFATRYSLNMFGYQPDELTGKMKFWDIFDDSEKERAEKDFRWFLTGHIFGATEYLGKKKDGTSFQIMLNMSYIFSGSEICGLRGVAIDISQRKSMEKALRRSEKKYRSLFENSSDAVLIHYKNGEIIDLNKRLTEILGCSRDEMLGGSIYDFYSGSFHDNIKGLLGDVDKEESLFFEAEMLHKDGEMVFVEVSASIVSSGSGTIQSVIRDITEKKKAREALVESEKRFRNLTDLLPQIVYELDSSGIVTFANKNAFESFQVSQDDFSKGIKFWDVLAPEDRDKAKEVFSWILSGHFSETAYEYMAKRSDGTSFPMLTYTSLIEKGGAVLGARGIGIDISVRKSMEEALRVSEERLNLAIQGAGVCVWDWDMEGDQMYFSGNYGEMFGCSLDDVRNHQSGWREILQVQFFSDVMNFFTDVVDVEERGFDPESHHFESEYHMKCKDGTYKWINLMGKIAEWDDMGIPLRIVGIMQDITQIKQYRDAIHEANKKLNLLSSITRHDILNQVAGINGFTDLLYRKVAGDEELTHHLDRIKQASGNIKEQITFTRDYHNVGVESPQWQRVDKIALNLMAKAKNTGIDLTIGCGHLEIYADPMLEKIFFNFIDNAVRHGERVTEISLSFERYPEKGLIVICDNGVGVPENLKERIFDHGFGSNTGLGLFLTKEILGITGLEISENGTPGKGARFEIEIPPENYHFAE